MKITSVAVLVGCLLGQAYCRARGKAHLSLDLVENNGHIEVEQVQVDGKRDENETPPAIPPKQNPRPWRQNGGEETNGNISSGTGASAFARRFPNYNPENAGYNSPYKTSDRDSYLRRRLPALPSADDRLRSRSPSEPSNSPLPSPQERRRSRLERRDSFEKRGVNRGNVPTMPCDKVMLTCTLSGIDRSGWDACEKCGNETYTDGKCPRQAYSYLQLAVVENTYTRDGLTPMPAKPLVGPEKLLKAFDFAAEHDQREDMYCNDYVCNRLRDSKSCISQLPPQDQGECGSCWIFANVLHLEILMCMEQGSARGVRTLSEMYVATCVHVQDKNACLGGNSFEFALLLEHLKYIPPKESFPYRVPLYNSCPPWQSMWTNNLPSITLLPPGPNSLNSFYGYILYKPEDFLPDRLEDFIRLTKEIIKEKGSALASLHGSDIMSHSYVGKDVMLHCQETPGTHVMVVIGYGTYQKRSPDGRGYTVGRYWLIRNSWGPNWGDEGNFRLDMDGPSGCNGRVFTYISAMNARIKNQNMRPPQGYIPRDMDQSKKRVRMILSQFTVKYGNQVYTRRIHRPSWVNFAKDEASCYRAYSIDMDAEKTERCVQECVKHLELCPDHRVGVLGKCLHSHIKSTNCHFCAV